LNRPTKNTVCALLFIAGDVIAGGACSKSGANTVVINTTHHTHIRRVSVTNIKKITVQQSLDSAMRRKSNTKSSESVTSKTSRQGSKSKRKKMRGLKAARDVDPRMAEEVNEQLQVVLGGLIQMPVIKVMSDYLGGDCVDKDKYIKKSTPEDWKILLQTRDSRQFAYLNGRERSDFYPDIAVQLEDKKTTLATLQGFEKVCTTQLSKLMRKLPDAAHHSDEALLKEQLKIEEKIYLIKLYQMYDRIINLEDKITKDIFQPVKIEWNKAQRDKERAAIQGRFIENADQARAFCAKKYALLEDEIMNSFDEQDAELLLHLIADKKKLFDKDIDIWCKSENWGALVDLAKRAHHVVHHLKNVSSHGDGSIAMARASVRLDSTRFAAVKTPAMPTRELRDSF